MNKSNLIITIICTLLCVNLTVLAQPKGMIFNNKDKKEDKIETPAPTPNPTSPTPEPIKPSTTQEPVEGTGNNIYGQPVPPVNQPPTNSTVPGNLNRGEISTGVSTNTGGNNTTPSGPIKTLPRGGDDLGGTDIPAPPNYEEGEFVKEPLVQDGIYEKISVKEREVLKYDDIREADVLWSKRIWRVIDTREKMNLTFAYPDQPFVGILLDIINKSDKVKIFADDDFTIETSAEEVMSRLGATEEISVYNPVTEEYETEIVSNDFNPELITKIRIKEDWVFDEEA